MAEVGLCIKEGFGDEGIAGGRGGDVVGKNAGEFGAKGGEGGAAQGELDRGEPDGGER